MKGEKTGTMQTTTKPIQQESESMLNYLIAFYLICNFHILFFKVMTSVGWRFTMSILITSVQDFFGLPLPLLKPIITNLSNYHIGASAHVLFACLNYLKPCFPYLFHNRGPPHLALNIFISNLSFLVCPRIHLNIPISQLSSSEYESS